ERARVGVVLRPFELDRVIAGVELALERRRAGVRAVEEDANVVAVRLAHDERAGLLLRLELDLEADRLARVDVDLPRERLESRFGHLDGVLVDRDAAGDLRRTGGGRLLVDLDR